MSPKVKKLRYGCNIPGELMRSLGKRDPNQRRVKEIESSGLINH